MTPHSAVFLCSCLAARAQREDHAGRDAIASAVLSHAKARPLLRTAQAMRASLLASAMASTLWCSRERRAWAATIPSATRLIYPSLAMTSPVRAVPFGQNPIARDARPVLRC